MNLDFYPTLSYYSLASTKMIELRRKVEVRKVRTPPIQLEKVMDNIHLRRGNAAYGIVPQRQY